MNLRKVLGIWAFGLCLATATTAKQEFAEKVESRKKPKIERSNEFKIKRLITRHYDKTSRPVRNDSTPVEVNIAISLYHILDTDEKQQTFTCLLAIRQRWRDEYLVWDPLEFGKVDTVRIPANTIWTPDLVISNFAGDKFNDYMVTNTIIGADGTVLWLYPALIKTYCTLDVKYFPFDSQACKIEFISWTHSGDQLDLFFNDTFGNSIYYTPENQEWTVNGITAERHVKFYACCTEPYPDVTFTIHMSRGSLFYIVNLIAPCFLIFLISFLGFFLPVESGEKVNLETTILLALVVFLLMVGDMMPPTPDSIPILGMFFGSTMVMVTIALVMAVIVTNIFSKKDSQSPAPRWIVKLSAYFYPLSIPERPDLTTYHHQQQQHQPLQTQNKHDCYSNNRGHGDILSISDGELESLSCCGCCNHTHTCRRGSGSITRQLELDRMDIEWRMVARFSDRCFFWLFVIISTCTFTVLFLKMVPPVPKIDTPNMDTPESTS